MLIPWIITSSKVLFLKTPITGNTLKIPIITKILKKYGFLNFLLSTKNNPKYTVAIQNLAVPVGKLTTIINILVNKNLNFLYTYPFFCINNKFIATYITGTALKVFETISLKLDDSIFNELVALANKLPNPVLTIIYTLQRIEAIKNIPITNFIFIISLFFSWLLFVLSLKEILYVIIYVNMNTVISKFANIIFSSVIK